MLPSVAAFMLPLLVGQASPLVIMLKIFSPYGETFYPGKSCRRPNLYIYDHIPGMGCLQSPHLLSLIWFSNIEKPARLITMRLQCGQ